MRLLRSLCIVCITLHAPASSSPPLRDPEYGHFEATDDATTSICYKSASGALDVSSALETALEMPDGDYFIGAVGPGDLRKRQQEGVTYISPDGTYSNDCATAPIYQIRNASLTTTLGGVTYTYSTSPGVPWQIMVPSRQIGSIITRFTFGGDGAVAWKNPAFAGGQARFCAVDNGTVYAVFTSGVNPTGCVNTKLLLFLVSSCAKWISRWAQTTTLRESYVPPARVIVTTYETTLEASTVTTTAIITQGASTMTTTFATTIPPTTVTTTATRTLTETTTPDAVTTTLQVTITSCPQLPAPSACNNAGTQYAAFQNNQSSYANRSAGSAYPGFDPEFMRLGPNQGTWTNRFANGSFDKIPGFTTRGCPNPPGTAVDPYNATVSYSCLHFAHLYRGYIFVSASGVWTFSITGTDDAVIFWGGALARSGWTKANADLSLWFTDRDRGNHRNGLVSFNLVAGTYFPIRFAYGQAIGGYGFRTLVTDPCGRVAFDSNVDTPSPYIVQHACNDTSAPLWTTAIGEEP